MRIIINILAAIGLLAVLGVIVLAIKLTPVLRDFDPQAPALYREFAGKLLTTGDLTSMLIWSVPVKEGISVEDVKQSLKSLAVEKNFLFVGEAPFYKQAQAVTGQPYRHVAFMQFCDVRTGMMLADYNNAFTAMMPCNISVVEDKQGKLWLYAMNLDFLIHGAREFPPELKEKALRVRQTIRELMEGAAKGEF